ncbi:transmembrane and coiled-coil domains-containing protein 7 [Mortierella sp. GBA30]|nr:transmembrane and coiled-coil domains-containing protein 7 [Mortierella sp. GBA30]
MNLDEDTHLANEVSRGEESHRKEDDSVQESDFKLMEAKLKTNLRMIDALAGKRVDIQNIDQELHKRLEDLASLRREASDRMVQHHQVQHEGEQSSAADTADTQQNTSQGDNCEVSVDVRSKFVTESVSLLIKLEEILLSLIRDRDVNDPTNDKELLGLMDQRMIHTMLEIVVCWGIYPCLLPGVGMPLNRRIRSNIAQKELFMAGPTGNSNLESAPVDQFRSTKNLWSIVEPLARITTAYSPRVTRFTTLGSVLANRHVPDLYAALLQLAYRPLPKSPASTPSPLLENTSDSAARPAKLTPGSLLSKGSRPSSGESTTTSTSRPTLQPEEYEPEKRRLLQQKEESAKLFHDLFWNTEAARSLESLTILLSSSSPSHPTPAWLKSVSGRFLSQILLRPGGVRVVLEYMHGGSDAIKLDQLEKIARLVTSVPDQLSSVQEYYRTICPELLEILETDLKLVDPEKEMSAQGAQRLQHRTTPPSPQLVQIATFVVGKLLIKNPAICQVEIVAKEVEPLWKWGTWTNRKGPVAADTVPTKPKGITIEEIVEDEGDDDATGMDPIVASEYEVVKAVMFLHSFLVGNEPSPTLFQAFLAQAAQGLYQLYEFSSQVRSVLREKAKEILIVYLRIIDPTETIEVLRAIVMRRRMPIPGSKPWLNLISTDGRRIGDLVDMGSAGECYFAPGPTGGAVLRRRSTQDRNAATQLELDVDVFLDFLSELETSGKEGEILGDLYMYLLDEYQAGKARGPNAVSPRRMLTMLQLILSMTQKLGPSIMSKVTQIISLANNILEHQTSEMEEQQEEQDSLPREADDADAEEADTEILGLVLTLLTAILNENENLSQQDRHLLALTLLHLKRLSDHPLIEIRRVAHDLQTVIPTRLSDASAVAADATKKTEMEIEMEKYASALAALQDSLLPVRAHGLHILREMILAKSVVLTKSLGGQEADRELDHALDIFVQHVQEPDSFIYLNAVKGLAALTDAHGPEILRKLMTIYANDNGKQQLDTRLRIGEALVQTVQRCGEALGGYLDALLPGLYKVMNTEKNKQVLEAREEERKKKVEKEKTKRASEALLTPEERQQKWREERDRKKQQDGGAARSDVEEDQDEIVDEVSLLRSSALTILATAAESCPTALLPEMRFLVDWVLSILDLDRQTEVRRGATLVLVLLFRALGTNSLYRVEGDQLKQAYRTLRYVEQVDEDALCRAQARTGIADLDAIVRMEIDPERAGSRMDASRNTVLGGSMDGAGSMEIRYK